MGSTLSLQNDTDDIIMVKLTANTKVIAPIVAGLVAVGGAALTVLSGGLAGGITVAGTTITYAALAAGGVAISAALANEITSTILNDFETKLISGYEKEGFKKVLPGKTWKGPKQTLSLNQRMWLVRLTRGSDTMSIRTADSSVWTGPTDGSNLNYKASDTKYFKYKLQDTYNVKPDATKVRGGAMSAVLDDTPRGGAIKPPHPVFAGLAGNVFRPLLAVFTGVLLASSQQHQLQQIGGESSSGGAAMGGLLGRNHRYMAASKNTLGMLPGGNFPTSPFTMSGSTPRPRSPGTTNFDDIFD